MNFLRWVKQRLSRSVRYALGLSSLDDKLEETKLLLGRLFAEQIRSKGVCRNLRDVEFKVFSQFGEDGIIQYLIHQVGITPAEEIFVEFGVQDYVESNTRFLLLNDNWRGLVMDGSEENIRTIQTSPYYWRHDLTAARAFIDAENINDLLAKYGFTGPIGILSIDIDGNDYWVWEKINVIQPLIVSIEYNSLFGAREPVTIPYDPTFVRNRAHYSNLYWGSSIQALDHLARGKGYVCVGSNSAGNNVFFVRSDRLGALREIDAAAAYVPARFRESRDRFDKLTFLGQQEALRLIAESPLYHVVRKKEVMAGALVTHVSD